MGRNSYSWFLEKEGSPLPRINVAPETLGRWKMGFLVGLDLKALEVKPYTIPQR